MSHAPLVRVRMTRAVIEASAKAVWKLRNPGCKWEDAPAIWQMRYKASARIGLLAAVKHWRGGVAR